MPTSETTITATCTLAGLHHWPGAFDQRAYLANPHRHLFHVTAEVAVGHADRDVEFHDLAEQLRDELEGLGVLYHPASSLIDFGAKSCETLAIGLAGILANVYDYRVVAVTVSEDGENHATIRPKEHQS